MSRLRFDLFFLVGAPRSGTTLMHGLLCTHPRANPYIGEASYLHGLLKAWRSGLDHWAQTGGFFRDQAHFQGFYRELMYQTLDGFHEHFGRPDLLILKDPALTTNLLAFHEMIPECRFILCLRDPRAVVASILEVSKKRQGRGGEDNEAFPNLDQILARLCSSYNRVYQPLLNQWDALASFVHLMKYEDLLVHQDFTDLARFMGCEPEDFSFDRLWQGSEGRFAQDSPYHADGWGKKADPSVAEKFRNKFQPHRLRQIESLCESIFQRFYA